jgi:ankyrin repeat protein
LLQEREMLDRICAGRTDLVFDFLAAGEPASSTDGNDVPLIRWCAYYGDVSAIRYLLERGEKLESLGDNLDLNGAAFHGHWRLCEFLIEAGAKPNHRHGDAGETPLHATLSRANRVVQDQVVRVLLEAGADPNMPTVAGAETGCFMRDSRAKGETPLHRAAAFSSEATLEALLAAGAKREARDEHGDTPLSWASWHLRPASIMRMLCYGDLTIHRAACWTGDHGSGASGMDIHLVGRPLPK